MSENNVTVSVPNEGFALRAAARLFEELAAGKEGPTTRGLISVKEAKERYCTPPDSLAPAPPLPDQAAEQFASAPATLETVDVPLKGDGVELPCTTSPTPPAPPAPPAPEPEVTPPAPLNIPAPATAVDSDGLPWDKRIHGSGKTFLAKTGQWKKKRGVSAELVAQVEAELRAGGGAIAPPGGAPATPAATPAAPPAPPAPPTPGSPAALTFVDLMKLYQESGVGLATANTIAQEHGCTSLATVGTKPECIQAVYDAIKGAF